MKLKVPQSVCLLDHLLTFVSPVHLFCFALLLLGNASSAGIVWWLFLFVLFRFVKVCEERCRTRSSSFLAKNCSKIERKVVFYLQGCWVDQWCRKADLSPYSVSFDFFTEWCDILFIAWVQQEAKSMLRNTRVSVFTPPSPTHMHFIEMKTWRSCVHQ